MDLIQQIRCGKSQDLDLSLETVNFIDDYGMTPLLWAVDNDTEVILQILSINGVDVNYQTPIDNQHFL